MIQALQRGLEILDALADADAPMRCKALAEHLAVDTSTAHRLLETLAARGYVAKDEKSKMYTLGIASLAVARAFLAKLDVRAAARSHLEVLAARTGECLHLAVMRDNQAVFVDRVSGTHRLTANTEIGQAEPLHCTAVGKALLTALDGLRLRALLPGRLSRHTPNTKTTFAALRADLAESRRRGWTEDDEEYQTGIRCVASWILDFGNNPVASIGLSAPKARMTTQEARRFGESLSKAAEDISTRLGASVKAHADTAL